MRVLFDLVHPAHVHFFKHVIWHLEEQGHEVLITARDKDVTLALLDHYGFTYQTLSAIGNNYWELYVEFLKREWALWRLIREFNPDVVASLAGVLIALVSKLMGKPAIVFTDTEHIAIDRYLTYPFAPKIYTPECFKHDLGKRHVRYSGFHELAYLHPNHFQPDPTVLTELGVSVGEPFTILRFVAWKASHDLGQTGFPLSLKREMLQTLGRYGRVFITAEEELSPEFEPFRITVPPSRIHDVLAYANLYLGEGATMATEAGILGTPSIYASSLVGTMGNFVELMERYKLVYSYRNPNEAFQQAVSLLKQGNAKEEWKCRREKLLAEKIDVTKFVIELLEQYVNSAR